MIERGHAIATTTITGKIEAPVRRRRMRLFPLLLLLPAVLWVIAFTIYPLASALRYSFANYVMGQGVTGYVGFANYKDVIHNSEFWHSIWFTALYAAISVSLEMIIGFVLAWFVSLSPPGHKIFRAINTAPLFTMGVAIGYLGVTLYASPGGLVDGVLGTLGIHIPWMSTQFGGLFGAVLLDIWRWTSFIFLIALAGLVGIPEEIYEAAVLDTSNQWPLMRNIALPMVWPVLTIAFLLRLVEAFKVFGLPYAMTSGGPGTSTQTFSTLDYLTTVQFFDFGHGSAMGFLYLIIVSVVLVIFFRRMRRLID